MKKLFTLFIGLITFVLSPELGLADTLEKNSSTGEVMYFSKTIQIPQTDQVLTQEIRLPYAFDSFSVENVYGAQIDLAVYLDNGERVVVSNEDELHKEKSDNNQSELFFDHPRESLKYEVRSRFSGQAQLTFHFINSRVGTVEHPLTAAASDLQGLRIIKRSEWGANESLRMLSETPDGETQDFLNSDRQTVCADLLKQFPDELSYSKVIGKDSQGQYYKWPLQYSKTVKKIVIHHTAEGEMAAEKSAVERMRALYAYHTLSRGWGDIGYNYVIGPNGEIFEGRAGGDKVVGGHTLCNNVGTVGISMMGNFEDSYPNLKQINATIALVSSLAKNYNIDPLKADKYHGERKNNLLGHRDLKPTACPGANLYAMLDFIKKQAAKNIGMTGGDILTNFSGYAARVVTEPNSLHLEPNKEAEVIYKFKNIGEQAWNNETWLYVYGNPQEHLEVAARSASQEYVAADLVEPIVSPGEIGSFKVKYQAGSGSPKGEIVNSFEFTPVFNGKYRSDSASIVQVAIVDPSKLSYQIVSMDVPQTSLAYGAEISGSITLRNTGNVTWVNSGEHPMVLGTTRSRDRISKLQPEGRNRVGQLREERVAPGETGTFIVSIKAPNRAGRYTEFVEPVIEGLGWLGDKGLSYTVDVREPLMRVDMALSESQITVLPGKKKNLELTVSNTGDSAWENGKLRFNIQSDQRAEIYLEGGNESVSSFTLDQTIQPNESVKLNLQLKIPGTARGLSSITLQPEYEGYSKKILSRSFLRLQIKDPNLQAMPLLNMKERILQVKEGEKKQLTVKFQNTGDLAWYNEGEFPSYLEPQLINQTQGIEISAPIMLQERIVKPGETGSFVINFSTKRPGLFRVQFSVAVENMGKTKRLPMKLVIRSLADPNNKRTEIIEKENTNASPTTAKPKPTPINQLSPTPSTPVQEKSNSDLMRVKLGFSGSETIIKSESAFRVTDLNNKELLTIKKGDAFKLSQAGDLIQSAATENKLLGLRMVPLASNGILRVDNWSHRPAWNQSLNDNEFRGVLEARVLDKQLTIINELPLEDYLKGVAEVPNGEPYEKQKAMAVLARSYAKFYLDPANRKFPDQPYDGSDDPDVFQKYLGYGYEKRTPRFLEALRDTDGEVVMYEGKLIKTPYFSQSDGRTRSAQEVWGWENTPYLQSVDDPYCAGKTLLGHGVGLSGCGAKAMAEAGKGYREIIEYYYRGVEVGGQ